MKLVKEGDRVGEHDIYLGPATVDGRPIGNGAPGLVTSQLRQDFHRHAEIS